MQATRLTARNTATESPNRIHDETVARSYGFAGGLVPGVTVFAWMCAAPLAAFGEAWLDGGAIDARFVRPVYDGDEVEVAAEPGRDGDLALTVRKGDEACATGRAWASHGEPGGPIPARAPLPADPPVASPATLAPGTTLGTLDVTFDAARSREYLREVGADHEMPSNLAHPGWLLLLANLALSSNVALGPWIHGSSDVRLFGRVSDGDSVAAHAAVVAEYERKGHRFVELDLALVVGGSRRVAVRHTAIYRPRVS